MKSAVDQLQKNYKLLESHFREFYPQIQEFSKTKLEEINN
jgi:acyl carrier protein phosphodiesterase